PENVHLAYKAANLMQAHNEYIQAFCESGVIGGILFLTIWISGFFYLFKLAKKNKLYLGLFGMYIAILIHSLVDSPLHVLPISVLMYVLLGVANIKTFRVSIHKRVVQYLLIAVFAIFSLFMLNKSYQQSKGYIAWHKAVKADKYQKFAIAIPKYEQALKYLPEQGELLFNLGANYSSTGNFEMGIYYLVKSLIYMTDRNQLLSLSQSYLSIKNNVKAEEHASLANRCFPDHLLPKFLLGIIYYRLGKHDESQVMLDMCINEETTIKSEATRQIAEMAKTEKRRFYGE
ncbi:O-antigen ligase family protein, partial [bacterium]|nr:O-antigen ligase family protein [bacterium]